jgi:hypothetical protein
MENKLFLLVQTQEEKMLEELKFMDLYLVLFMELMDYLNGQEKDFSTKVKLKVKLTNLSNDIQDI